MVHLAGHEKLHDALLITVSHYTNTHNTEKQPFRNRFLYDLDHFLWWLAKRANHGLWKVVGHLAILHGKLPMASSNFLSLKGYPFCLEC